MISMLAMGEYHMVTDGDNTFTLNPILPWQGVLSIRCGWNDLFLRNPLKLPVAAIVEILPVIWKTVCIVWNAFKAIKGLFKARGTKALKTDGVTVTA